VEVIPHITNFIQSLKQAGGRAKAGASSKGVRLDGRRFDTTHGRWRHHLGAYFPYAG
jgi:hypothetical protein